MMVSQKHWRFGVAFVRKSSCISLSNVPSKCGFFLTCTTSLRENAKNADRKEEAKLLAHGPGQRHTLDQHAHDEGADDVDDQRAKRKARDEKQARQEIDQIAEGGTEGTARGDHQEIFHVPFPRALAPDALR